MLYPYLYFKPISEILNNNNNSDEFFLDLLHNLVIN